MVPARRSLAAHAIAVALAAWTAAHAQAPVEDDVKAAFLLNFTRYVEWPPEGPGGGGRFRICMLASEDLAERLATLAAGEAAAGRPLEVVRATAVSGLGACQMLFVDRRSTERFTREAPSLRGMPVLTVGEAEGFHDHGGVIRLFLDGNRFRFTVHTGHAASAGLRISARLLRLAREVYTHP